ncbi:hypothetical protein RCHARTNEY_39 [Rhodobacter phage RcHartney]|nr:hypothetical protein RCHARTNEY_39 [Rhodobacter phage RcHartney]
MSEFTALLAATVFAALIVFSVVGNGAKTAAENIFNPGTADFSAKFVKP